MKRSFARQRISRWTKCREQARNLCANAIVGIDIDYETIGTNSSMLMVSANGTAVVVE